MATVAKLYIDGMGSFSDGIYIAECSYGIEQLFDSSGKPSGRPVGGKISLVIDSLLDNINLFEWAVNEFDLRSGTIEFMNEVEETDIVTTSTEKKTLSFTDAACVSFYESFVSSGVSRTQLTIVAKSISLDDVKYNNPWPE